MPGMDTSALWPAEAAYRWLDAAPDLGLLLLGLLLMAYVLRHVRFSRGPA